MNNEETYERYIDELFSYGKYFSIDNDTLIDLIHDVFLSFYLKDKNSIDDDNIKFYLLCSLKNKIISFWRKKQMHNISIEHDLSFELVMEYQDALVEHEEEMNFKKQVNRILESLTSRQREAIYLRYILELETKEVAKILNITEKSVRKIIYRAFDNISKDFANPFTMIFLFM